MIVVGAFGSADSYTVSSPFNTSTTRAASSAASAFGGGGAIGMIVATWGLLVALYIIALVVGSISYGITNYGCIP